MTDHENLKSPRTIPLGFRIIGALKIVTAVLLLAALFGIFRMMDEDTGSVLEHIIMKLHLDPENRLVNTASFYLLGIDRRHMEAFGAGTLFYALLYGIEGIGIFFGFHWAEYLIVGTTGALIPVEIYEIARRVGPVKVTVFLVNLAILMYFIRQLRRERWQKVASSQLPP